MTKYCSACYHSINAHRKDSMGWNCGVNECYCPYNPQEDPEMFIEEGNKGVQDK